MVENRGYLYTAPGDSEGTMMYISFGSTCSRNVEKDDRTWTLYSKNSVSPPTSFEVENIGSQIKFVFSDSGKYVKYNLNKSVATKVNHLVS